MSRTPNQKHRHLVFQGLEERRLLAADLKTAYEAPSEVADQEKTQSAYVATAEHETAAPAAEATSAAIEADLKETAKLAESDLVDVDMEHAAEVDAVFDKVDAEDLGGTGVGLDGEELSYDTIDALDSSHGMIGGEFDPSIDKGYSSSLDGANTDDHAGEAHDMSPPKPGDAAANKKATYGQELNVTDKTENQMDHACVSLNPGAYEKKDEGSGGTFTMPGEINVDHGKTKTDTGGGNAGVPTATGAGGGGDAEDDAAGDDGSGDGDGGETPPADNDANSPDYGEGYLDPNDPIAQVASEFTDAYMWQTYQANADGEVNPDPNSDPVSVEFSPVDAKSWVDGWTYQPMTEMVDVPGVEDGGNIDPADHE